MAPPLSRVWYDTLVDDDGSGTVGTIWNKSQIDGLMDAVDASLATVPILNGGNTFTGEQTIDGDLIVTGEINPTVREEKLRKVNQLIGEAGGARTLMSDDLSSGLSMRHDKTNAVGRIAVGNYDSQTYQPLALEVEAFQVKTGASPATLIEHLRVHPSGGVTVGSAAFHATDPGVGVVAAENGFLPVALTKPGGTNQQLQFNDNGVLAGTGTVVFDKFNNNVGGINTLYAQGVLASTMYATQILQPTADGADNGALSLAGGGAPDASRGGFMTLGGNESGYGGSIGIRPGVGGGLNLLRGSDGFTILSMDAGGILNLHAGWLHFPIGQPYPSSDPYTLDDYREGEFTPFLAAYGGWSGQSYSQQVGRYIKIGKLVTAWFTVQLSVKGTFTAGMVLHGLPFNADGGMNRTSVCAIQFSALATTWLTVVGQLPPSVNYLELTGQKTADYNNANLLQPADISANTMMTGCIVYQAPN